MKDPFEALRPLERHHVAGLLSACPRVALEAGRSARDFPDAPLLLVERGLAALAATSGTRRTIVTFCRPNAVVSPPGAGQELLAISDCTVVLVTKDAYCSLLELPTTALAIVESLLESLRERDESLAQLANVSHAERLRAKLSQLARAHGTPIDGTIRIELPLTHELLGQTIGSARETVTAAFKALEAEGFVARNGRSYYLAA